MEQLVQQGMEANGTRDDWRNAKRQCVLLSMYDHVRQFYSIEKKNSCFAQCHCGRRERSLLCSRSEEWRLFVLSVLSVWKREQRGCYLDFFVFSNVVSAVRFSPYIIFCKVFSIHNDSLKSWTACFLWSFFNIPHLEWRVIIRIRVDIFLATILKFFKFR